MEKFIFFLKIITWIVAPASTIFLAMCIYGNLKYPGSVDELYDKLKGVQRTYPIKKWLILAIVCWAFIIAF